MKMKKFGFFIILLFYFSVMYSQQCDIPLQVAYPEDFNSMPESSINLMSNILRQIVTANGMVGSTENSRWAIVPSCDVLSKHVIPGPPVKVVYNLAITLSVVDLDAKKVFSTCGIEADGVGSNMNDAYVSGVKQIGKKNNAVVGMLERAKSKILQYYNSNYKKIIKTAQTLASMKRYEEALYNLAFIPECCDGYDEAVKVSLSIFKPYSDRAAQENLNKARSIWTSGQDAESAKVAGEYLSRIFPDDPSYNEAMNLYKDIQQRVSDNLQFNMQVYNDNVALEQQRIAAAKDVGMSYGNNQKEETTNLLWLK